MPWLAAGFVTDFAERNLLLTLQKANDFAVRNKVGIHSKLVKFAGLEPDSAPSHRVTEPESETKSES